VTEALKEPNGLLAVGGCLSPQRLVSAYRQGIFPWYGEGEPVLWWSPEPRMVLYCSEFRVSRSLQKVLRRSVHDPTVEILVDRAFEEVMRACASPRSDEAGTWITPEVIRAYGALHARGLAHSVETWIDGQLAGGLYGVSMGRMFFGESMFTRAPDASKLALAALVRILLSEHVPVIDCQQNTRHLASLGGREIARHRFCSHVRKAVQETPIDWGRYRHRLNEQLATAFERPAD
jgi:leucyl/phenylalanyl-tRNA--protein transferase